MNSRSNVPPQEKSGAGLVNQTFGSRKGEATSMPNPFQPDQYPSSSRRSRKYRTYKQKRNDNDDDADAGPSAGKRTAAAASALSPFFRPANNVLGKIGKGGRRTFLFGGGKGAGEERFDDPAETGGYMYGDPFRESYDTLSFLEGEYNKPHSFSQNNLAIKEISPSPSRDVALRRRQQEPFEDEEDVGGGGIYLPGSLSLSLFDQPQRGTKTEATGGNERLVEEAKKIKDKDQRTHRKSKRGKHGPQTIVAAKSYGVPVSPYEANKLYKKLFSGDAGDGDSDNEDTSYGEVWSSDEAGSFSMEVCAATLSTKAEVDDRRRRSNRGSAVSAHVVSPSPPKWARPLLEHADKTSTSTPQMPSTPTTTASSITSPHVVDALPHERTLGGRCDSFADETKNLGRVDGLGLSPPTSPAGMVEIYIDDDSADFHAHALATDSGAKVKEGTFVTPTGSGDAISTGTCTSLGVPAKSKHRNVHHDSGVPKRLCCVQKVEYEKMKLNKGEDFLPYSTPDRAAQTVGTESNLLGNDGSGGRKESDLFGGIEREEQEAEKILTKAETKIMTTVEVLELYKKLLSIDVPNDILETTAQTTLTETKKMVPPEVSPPMMDVVPDEEVESRSSSHGDDALGEGKKSGLLGVAKREEQEVGDGGKLSPTITNNTICASRNDNENTNSAKEVATIAMASRTAPPAAKDLLCNQTESSSSGSNDKESFDGGTGEKHSPASSDDSVKPSRDCNDGANKVKVFKVISLSATRTESSDTCPSTVGAASLTLSDSGVGNEKMFFEGEERVIPLPISMFHSDQMSDGSGDNDLSATVATAALSPNASPSTADTLLHEQTCMNVGRNSESKDFGGTFSLPKGKVDALIVQTSHLLTNESQSKDDQGQENELRLDHDNGRIRGQPLSPSPSPSPQITPSRPSPGGVWPLPTSTGHSDETSADNEINDVCAAVAAVALSLKPMQVKIDGSGEIVRTSHLSTDEFQSKEDQGQQKNLHLDSDDDSSTQDYSMPPLPPMMPLLVDQGVSSPDLPVDMVGCNCGDDSWSNHCDAEEGNVDRVGREISLHTSANNAIGVQSNDIDDIENANVGPAMNQLATLDDPNPPTVNALSHEHFDSKNAGDEEKEIGGGMSSPRILSSAIENEGDLDATPAKAMNPTAVPTETTEGNSPIVDAPLHERITTNGSGDNEEEKNKENNDQQQDSINAKPAKPTAPVTETLETSPATADASLDEVELSSEARRELWKRRHRRRRKEKQARHEAVKVDPKATKAVSAVSEAAANLVLTYLTACRKNGEAVDEQSYAESYTDTVTTISLT